MNVKIYSKKAIEELLNKADRLENTAVISFYDPPNVGSGRAKPVDYKGKTDMLFQVAVNDIDIEDLIQEEETVITLTNSGYIKRISADTYSAQRRGGRGIQAMTKIGRASCRERV